MSSNPSQSQSEGREERRKSIGNYVKRIGSMLKRDSSKRTETAVASSSRVQPIEVADSATQSTQSQQAAPSDKPLSSPKSEPTVTGPGKYVRSAVQEERARNLFAKYGLTLEAHEYYSLGGTGTATVHVERVEKPIRMRVTRTCHRCNVTFGPNKICVSCEHKRCKKCPRYPVKKNKNKSGGSDVKGKGKSKGEGVVAATGKGRKKDIYTLKTRSGQERTFDPPRQRIKRTCHMCQNLFNPPSLTVCSNCQHVRCTACPREPAKPKKFPDGYPGDASIGEEPASSTKPDRTWRKPRRRVRWFCSECSVMFMEGSKVCGSCNHERCESCTREPPKKAKKEFDPEVLKQVEERLAQYRVGD